MPLKHIITPKNVREQLGKLSPLNTPVMDDIYPASVRDTYPFDTISIDEISSIAKAVPVVNRGSASVTLGGGSSSLKTIEPLPIIVNKPITAAELNRIKTLTASGQSSWLRNTIDFARRTIRSTTEALCAQSLTGKISFAMKTEDGLDTYVVDYGNTLKITSNFTWGPSVKIGNIFSDLSDMAALIEENGGGAAVEFRAGKNVYARLLDVVGGLQSAAISTKVTDNAIYIGGYKISRYNTKYFDPATKKYKPVLNDNGIKAIAKDGGFAFRYLAIDDVDAGLQPLPLWLNPIKLSDPSGYKVIAQSKPLPIPSVKSICDATVTLA